MKDVDLGAMHFFVASDVGIALTRTAITNLNQEVRRSLASEDPTQKRKGLVLYGAALGLEKILDSECPGPSGIELQLDIKRIIVHHNPSRDEMATIIKLIRVTLVPIWRKGQEKTRQGQLKNIRTHDTRGSHPFR